MHACPASLESARVSDAPADWRSPTTCLHKPTALRPQSWTVSTFVNAGAAGTLSQLVVELGPEVDDTIVVAGATDAIITNQSVADADNAVTGGTKQFRGATGEFIYRNLANGTISAHIEVWVPRLKSF